MGQTPLFYTGTMNTKEAAAAAKPSKVHAIVTEKIIDLIQSEGKLPWQQEWSKTPLVGEWSPRNFRTGHVYGGGNRWLLSVLPYECPYYLPKSDIKRLGATIKEGERGHMILKRRAKVMIDINGEYTNDPKKCDRWFLRGKPSYALVWNLEQLEGIEIPERPLPEALPEVELVAEAEAVVDGYVNPPSIQLGGDKANYTPQTDVVKNPHPADFNSVPAYYGTLFHELAHSTGHVDRLAREGVVNFDRFGSDRYSFEELVAEMTAAMLSSLTGCWTDKVQTNNAAYLQGWCETFKGDPSMIISAASQAQSAAEHILGGPIDEWQAPSAS